MKLSLFVTVLALLAVTACGQPILAPSGPSQDDIDHELPRVLTQNILVDSSLNSCAEGEMNGADVMVCNICYVAVTVSATDQAFSGGQTGLLVTQGELSAAFSRALSYDQPSIRPKTGAAGVWIMRPDTVNEVGTRASVALPPELASRAGYRPRTGFEAMMSSTYGNQIPDEVRSRFQNDSELARDVRNLVNGCTPSTRSAPSSATPDSPSPSQSELDAARQRGAQAAALAAGSPALAIVGTWARSDDAGLTTEYRSDGTWTFRLYGSPNAEGRWRTIDADEFQIENTTTGETGVVRVEGSRIVGAGTTYFERIE